MVIQNQVTSGRDGCLLTVNKVKSLITTNHIQEASVNVDGAKFAFHGLP